MAKSIPQVLLGLCALSSVVLIANATPILNTRPSVAVGGEAAYVVARRISPEVSPIAADPILVERDAHWTVRAGDTGNKISAQLGIPFLQLAFMNPNVRWRFLQVGQTLNIPGDGNVNTHTYTIVAGDTGNAIAAANSISFAQLQSYNRNVDWYNLQIGQSLVIPGVSLDITRASRMPAIEQEEQYADVTATNSDTPIVSVVDNDIESPANTNERSPFLVPGETPLPSSERSAQTLEVRQVEVARPAAPLASVSTSGTTTYIVKAGDTGYGIAAQYGITFDALSKVNPGVSWVFLQIGQAISLPAGTITLTTAILSPAPQRTRSPPTLLSAVPSNSDSPTAGAYVTYSGTIDTAQPPYPPISVWLPFAQLWTRNAPNIGTSCVFLSGSVTPNTVSETTALRSAILEVSSETNLHPSFIFATIMQESNGCVRAPTTSSWEGIQNPGLMQSFNGRASCNAKGRTQLPCPDSLIKAMILEGAKGNQDVGIMPALQIAARQAGLQWPLKANVTANTDVNVNGNVQGQVPNANVQGSVKGVVSTGMNGPPVKQIDEGILYYQAARIYNSGSLSADGDLSAKTGSTRCYVSDMINRLLGWTGSPKICSLGR